MDKPSKIAYFHTVVIMLLSPAYSLYHGLKNPLFGSDAKRWLLILFITVYGSVITISEGADGWDHRNNVSVHYTELSFKQFLRETQDILFFRDNPEINEDLYIHVLSYFVGAILHLPGLFFVFVAFIYAYFFTGSLFRIKKSFPKKKYSWLFYGFLVVFLLLKNIEGMTTVRTWTGMWILFYACLSYYQTKKKKYLLLMFVPPLVHVGYFMMAIPAWVVLFAGARPKIYSIIFAVSFFVNLPNPERIFNQLEKTEVGTNKVSAYNVEEQVGIQEIAQKQEKKGSTWYRKTQKMGVHAIASNILAITLIIFMIYPKQMDSLEIHLFSIGILMKAFSNLTWVLFAVSARSGLIAIVFIVGAFILMWRRNYFEKAFFLKKKIMMGMLKISLLFFVPYIFYQLANMIYFVSIYVLAFPFIPWFLDDVNYSIREFIGLFL